MAAAARSVQRLKDLFGEIEISEFDFEDASTWSSSLDNIEKVFFIAPQPQPHESVKPFLQLAKDAGINHILYSSGRTTGGISGSPMNLVEELVKNSGLPFTIIRPGWFMQNFNSWIGASLPGDKAFYLPAGTSKTAFVDVRDVSAVAHAILESGSYIGETLALTSEAPLDHYQVASAISELTGVEIKYVDLPKAQYIQKLTEYGWSVESARFFGYIYELVASGCEEEVSSDVRRVLGRSPISFQQFLRDHKNDFLQLVAK